jgi:hypothetical protein
MRRLEDTEMRRLEAALRQEAASPNHRAGYLIGRGPPLLGRGLQAANAPGASFSALALPRAKSCGHRM